MSGLTRRSTLPVVAAWLLSAAAWGCAGGEATPGWRTDADVSEAVEGGDFEPGDESDGPPDADVPARACTTDVDCDDGIDCTIDSCDSDAETCRWEGVAGVCDDGNPCTGLERCDIVLGCLPGVPIDCGDGIDCTVDECDPLTAGCRSRADHARCVSPRLCDPSRGPDSGGCVDPPACATDADCSDRDACNGAETCGPDSRCRPGTPIVCDDRIACTADRCDPAAGRCVFTAPDRDSDTYPDVTCTGTDCDDMNPLINPGSSESCNAVDDDCDGLADESFECVRNDIGSCTTTCGSTGTRTCSNTCAWGACVAPRETCNGLDDDCVSGCDNGWECCQGTPQTQGCGFCGTQSRTCGPSCSWETWGACSDSGVCAPGTTELRACTCGGSESRTCTGSCTWGAWSGCPTGECTPGTTEARACTCGGSESRTCSASCFWGAWSGCPSGECTPGTTQSRACTCGGSESRTCSASCFWGAWSGCPSGECSPGTTESRSCTCGGSESRTCTASCFWGAWSGCPTGECTPGQTQTQSCGNCNTGTQSRTCSSSCFWGPWSVCVGGGACPPGSTQSCSNSCGVAGSQTCSATCTWGACCAPAEVCGNTCDDNCNGLTNEGCGPANDECSGATAISLSTGRTTVTGSTASATNSSGSCTAANDVWYRFTLTVRETVFINTYGSAYDTYLGYVSGTCGAAGGCTDDSCSTVQSELVYNMPAGTYYVVVDGYGTASGDFTLNIERLPVGANGVSWTIPAGTNTYSGTTSGSSLVSGSCGGGGPEHLYMWTRCPSAASGTFSAHTCNTGTNYDTVIYLRSAVTGADLACNDDDTTCSSSSLRSRISATVPAGAGMYGFYVDGYGTSAGAYAATMTRP